MTDIAPDIAPAPEPAAPAAPPPAAVPEVTIDTIPQVLADIEAMPGVGDVVKDQHARIHAELKKHRERTQPLVETVGALPEEWQREVTGFSRAIAQGLASGDMSAARAMAQAWVGTQQAPTDDPNRPMTHAEFQAAQQEAERKRNVEAVAAARRNELASLGYTDTKSPEAMTVMGLMLTGKSSAEANEAFEEMCLTKAQEIMARRGSQQNPITLPPSTAPGAQEPAGLATPDTGDPRADKKAAGRARLQARLAAAHQQLT